MNDVSHLLTASFETFEQLVAAKADETPSLEFKRKPSSGIDLQRDDKKLLGEAVSGFANAIGGVLVIGIGTENHEGVDRASVIAEIDDVEAVATRYRSYALSCTSPPVEKLEVRAVESGGGRGVVVIGVPQGQARPHMSNAPGHHTYYRRVIDRFVPMEAYEVEEMMRLKTSPELQLVAELKSEGVSGGEHIFGVRFGLANSSRATAKFPYIEYFQAPGGPPVAPYGLDGNGNNLWSRMPVASSSGVLFAAGAGQVLHPDQTLIVSKLYVKAVHLPSIVASGIRFAFGCEDCPKRESSISFSDEQFMIAVRGA